MARKPKQRSDQLGLLDARVATAPLVPGIREKVKAWREDGYKGVTDTTRSLLNYWFYTDHRLPDGRKFNGPGELRTILKADHQAFEHCLTAKLLTYALGRGLERYDKRTVSAIASRLPEHEYRFSGLILEIVKSLPFQSRRNASTP